MKVKDVILTAIVPALNGCNLRCAGCIIDQRKEAEVFGLRDSDFLRFFREGFQLPEVVAFGIQGHEPLLPQSWELSRKLLEMSIEAELTTSCVTNGVYLKRYVDSLMEVTHNVYVSIDSHEEAVHDKSRGKAGAWQQTVEGIHEVRKRFSNTKVGTEAFGEYIAINSILYPNQSKRLHGMPALLKSIGIKKWQVSPYISITKGMYLGKGYGSICEELHELSEISRNNGIIFVIGDEIKKLEHVGDLYETLSVGTLDATEIVARLSPDGSYSVGKEILKISGKRVWDTVIDPSLFIREAHASYLSQ